MLKSSHRPSAAALAPLLPGWTEHKAPTGHTYYYNAETKESTYKRPAAAEPAPQPAAPVVPYSVYGAVPNLADPNVANAYLAQINAAQQPQRHAQSHRGGHGHGHGGRGGGHEGRPKPEPVDRPRRKEAIPGCEPWILVYTKYSRRFVYNPVKKASYWRIPEKLMPAILEMDKARIRGKADDVEGKADAEEKADVQGKKEKTPAPAATADDEYGSEYEEIEVTDDEGEDHPSKRQRTEEPAYQEEAMEFTEADIAAQLQAMGEDYGLDPGEYDDGDAENWPEGAEGVPLSEDDAKYLFKDLLNDFGVNPYSPWEKLLEDGAIVEDVRYTALDTTRARRDCWDEWTREKIAELKEQRARQEKKDPRIAYMAFLQEKATPKLYWPEFKRKYKKEAPMKDLHVSDRDREKAYREHVGRLKLPQSRLKADLTALLRAQPVLQLNNKSSATNLPTAMLVDARYISLEPSVRDPLVEAYIGTLPPPPEDVEAAKDDEEKVKADEAKAKRERALAERNRVVEEQRRRRDKDVAHSKARLREEERELDLAMRVGKQGLQGQLASMSVQPDS